MLERETDLRDRLGRSQGMELHEARAIVEEVKRRAEVSAVR